MKLSLEQIQYIENYIKSFDIKYYEIYMEILDHMVLAVEEIMTENPEISLENAVLQAKKEGFGNKGFNGMMEERVKLAQKQATKHNNRIIKEYFTFPKIALTALVFIAYFIFLGFFENPIKANLVMVSIIMIIGIFQFFYFWKYTRINKFYVLKTQKLSNNYLVVFLGMNLNNIFINFGKDTLDFSSIWMKLIMSVIFTFSLVSLLVYIQVRKKTVIELKNEIFA